MEIQNNTRRPEIKSKAFYIPPEERYKRKIVPKAYEPNERTSTMSFKAPMSEERRLALLKLREAEQEKPGKLSTAVSYITGPVRYLTSAFTSKPEPVKKPPLKPVVQKRSVSPNKIPKNTSNEVDNDQEKEKLDESQIQELLQNGKNSQDQDHLKRKEREYAPVSKDSIEAKKIQALDNIKNAFKAKQRKEFGVEEKQMKPQPILMTDAKTATNMNDVTIRSSNKYSYRITSNEAVIETPPPKVRDPLKPVPPKPIRVTSDEPKADGKTIRIKGKKTSNVYNNRAAAWNSPKFKNSAKNMSHNLTDSDHSINEPMPQSIQRSLAKSIDASLVSNSGHKRSHLKSVPARLISESVNRSNSACIINSLTNDDDLTGGQLLNDFTAEMNEEPATDNLLFDEDVDVKTTTNVVLQSSENSTSAICSLMMKHPDPCLGSPFHVEDCKSQTLKPVVRPLNKSGHNSLPIETSGGQEKSNDSETVLDPPAESPTARQPLRKIAPNASGTQKIYGSNPTSFLPPGYKETIKATPKKTFKKAQNLKSRPYISKKQPKNEAFSPVQEKMIITKGGIRSELKNESSPRMYRKKFVSSTIPKSSEVSAEASPDIDKAKAFPREPDVETPQEPVTGALFKRTILSKQKSKPETTKSQLEETKPKEPSDSLALFPKEQERKIKAPQPEKSNLLSAYLSSAAAIVAGAFTPVKTEIDGRSTKHNQGEMKPVKNTEGIHEPPVVDAEGEQEGHDLGIISVTELGDFP